MKAVVVFCGLLAVALAWTVPPKYEVDTKPVDADFVSKQKKILSFFHYVGQLDYTAEYYKIGQEYDVAANIDKYTNKEAVEEFLEYYKAGFLPKYEVFSIFYPEMREEAIALFNLFYFAKDFETFYKTAAFARVHFNEYQFFYSFYVAIYHRPDCQGFVVPAPYEVYPDFFTNMENIYKARRIKMQDGLIEPDVASDYGIVKENDYYVFYTNYSSYWTYGNQEQRLAYFTEDVGLNAFYYYFHVIAPFWMHGERFGALKEHRGERYFFFYQQLLARYYMERLTNGLGEIPDFSWYHPLKTGYNPHLTTMAYPFASRNEYYNLKNEKTYSEIQFLDTYETSFLQFLQKGQFKAYNQDVDFYKYKSVNFVGNYWQGNPDLYESMDERNFYISYELIARYVLSAVPEDFTGNNVAPAALMFYQTSLRDPVFYQLYSKIIKYMLMYKEYLKPYSQDDLHYVGVKISDVKVDKLVTYFDYFDYDISSSIFKSKEDFKTFGPYFKIRQPRLNHKPFTVSIDVKSDVEGEAVFKIFMGPKYDSNGFPIKIEDNYMNFVELDWFKHKLTAGQNKIERSSDDFFYYKDDSVPMYDIYKFLEQGKVPTDMTADYELAPNRLMLPKGTEGGFPFQFFVFVYPYQAPAQAYKEYDFLIDTKPFGYPFDRPVYDIYFKQPNMFYEDVKIYFEGEHYPYQMNSPYYVPHPKH